MVKRRTLLSLSLGLSLGQSLSYSPAQAGITGPSKGLLPSRKNCSFVLEARNDLRRLASTAVTGDIIEREYTCPLCKEKVAVRLTDGPANSELA